MKFHVEIHKFSCIRIKNNNLKYTSFIREIPTKKKSLLIKIKLKKFTEFQVDLHGSFMEFFDLELLKILVGTFYSDKFKS